MAVIKFTIASVNTTSYLIIRARKTADPIPEVARIVFSPAQLANPQNVILPSVGELDAATYWVDFYTSSNNTDLQNLVSRVEYDAKNKRPISETRFYYPGGERDIDPVIDQPDLIDPYLNGKNVTKFYGVEGGRPLVPPEEGDIRKEFDYIVGGGLTLLKDKVFRYGSVIVVEITYTSTFDDGASNAGMYDGTVKVTSADSTLTDTARNKRIFIVPSTNKMNINLEWLSNVPEGKFYYFNMNGGSGSYCRLIAQSGDRIRFQGIGYTEVSIGQGESVRLEKYTDPDSGISAWYVIGEWKGFENVGEVISHYKALNYNVIMANGQVMDGFVQPRLWDYMNSLPANLIITDASVSAQPAGKEGMWVKGTNPSLREFRAPNLQDIYLKGLKSFTDYTLDPIFRPFGVPGAVEQDRVGDHEHVVPIPANKTSQGPSGYGKITSGNEPNEPGFLISLRTDGVYARPDDRNIVKNVGVIVYIRS